MCYCKSLMHPRRVAAVMLELMRTLINKTINKKLKGASVNSVIAKGQYEPTVDWPGHVWLQLRPCLWGWSRRRYCCHSRGPRTFSLATCLGWLLWGSSSSSTGTSLSTDVSLVQFIVIVLTDDDYDWYSCMFVTTSSRTERLTVCPCWPV